MVLTTFRLSKPGLSPPVYIAGTFTEWQPSIEMDHDAVFGSRDQHEFSKTVDVEPGEHQYKFRLGHGDWWVVDDTSPTETDESGNVNNIIRVWEDGRHETTVYEANSQTLPDQEEKPVSRDSSKESLASSVKPASDAATESVRSVASGQSILKGSGSKSPQVQNRGDGAAESAPAPKVNGVRARQDKAAEVPNRSFMKSLLCCFSTKTAFGMAAVSAVLVAFYMRR